MRKQPCKDKASLIEAYQQATKVYAEAVADLNHRIGTSSREQFDRLRRVAEDARQMANKALKELDGHIADHDC
jgi:hypothetical protein